VTLPDRRIRPADNGTDSEITGDATTAIVPPRALDVLDYGHAQFVAGYDKGHADGIKAATVDMARDLLHQQACHYLGLARRTAEAHHGPQWAEAIAQAAEVSI
jgi:hypothetical protein